MEKASKDSIRRACRDLLDPVASLALKCGMTWKEFSELSKSAFVEVATREFGIRGRPTNISRTSILTGISRKEVKRQRELLAAAAPPAVRKTTDATRVLSGWHQDSDFLDEAGDPLELAPEGAGPSFAALLERYGGDVAPQTMLKELIKTGAVVETGDGKLRAASRYYMPVPMEAESILRAGGVLRDLGNTLENNLAGGEQAVRRFEGTAVDERVDPAAVDEFRAFLEERAQALLEEVDVWLAEHRVRGRCGSGRDDDSDDPSREDSRQDLRGDPHDHSHHNNTIRLGVGVYAIDGPNRSGATS